MIVLNSKTFEELTTEATSDLEAVGFNTSPGSIAKLFMNIVNKYVAEIYDTLTVNHLRAFVTTANGDALDAIGLLLQCFRLTGETDDNFRYRITQQCLTLATSNETAVYLTALTVPGVAQVILKPYSMGAGSFSVIILTETGADDEQVKEDVRTALTNVHGYGIRYNVMTPTITYISLKQRLYIKDTVPDITKQEIRYNVQLALLEYLQNLGIGEDIVVDKITQIVMNTSSDIIEESNEEFYVRHGEDSYRERALYVNQSCKWFERFAPDIDSDSIIVI